MHIALEGLDIPPGHTLLLRDIAWHDFEAMAEESGEHRGMRLAYTHGLMEIMALLPGHEWDKEIKG